MLADLTAWARASSARRTASDRPGELGQRSSRRGARRFASAKTATPRAPIAAARFGGHPLRTGARGLMGSVEAIGHLPLGAIQATPVSSRMSTQMV